MSAYSGATVGGMAMHVLAPRAGLAALVLMLAACGADAPPRAPEPAPQPGVSVTGDARFGVVLGES